MTRHAVYQLQSQLTGATPAPLNLVAVLYVCWSVGGLDLGMSAVGMPYVACIGSDLWCAAHVGHDPMFMQFHEGLDATWCSLVVQPFFGLVCMYAMGSESGMPPESCQPLAENCSLGAYVHMHHPSTFNPLLGATHPDSNQTPVMEVAVQR